MSTRKKVPSFRHHKASSQGFVELNGRRIYLGRYDLPETRQRYDRTIAEWLAGGRSQHVSSQEISVTELVGRYWRFAQDYYRKPDGTATGSLPIVKRGLRRLRKLYGNSPAGEFGPLAFKTVRQSFIDDGLRRFTITRYMAVVKGVFRWAVAEELVPPSVYEGLRAVRGLAPGRSAAKESRPVRPVPIAHVEGIRDHVPAAVWGLIQLQQLTGARGSELFPIRSIDLDTSRPVWLYTPRDHKTVHHGHKRVIAFGPRSQSVLKPFMGQHPVNAPLFNPAESEMGRRAAKHSHYDRNSYCRCIARACKKAGVPHWSPHQLRHTNATAIRQEFGIEAAQVVLGHRSGGTTEIYAERDLGLVIEVMNKRG